MPEETDEDEETERGRGVMPTERGEAIELPSLPSPSPPPPLTPLPVI
jgi:hypothetical protein